MEKNEYFTGEVAALGSEGEGIINKDGITFFVPFCFTGEKVRVKILRVKGNIGYGKAEEILSPSPYRVNPPCPVFGKCGGCQLQHIAYPEQLKFKRSLVENDLKKIGGIDFSADETVGGGKKFAYRNKLQLPVGVDGGGNTVIGFYAARSHRIVPVTNCLIQPGWAKDVIAALSSYMAEFSLKGYNEADGTGDIRHLVVREIGDKFIVALVSPKGKIAGIEAFAEKLKGVFSEYTLVLNVNKSYGNAVFGEKFINIVGLGSFETEECGIKYSATANTFLQVNENVRKILYAEAINEAADDENAVVIDAYSGGGMMTAMAARRVKRAYGIEVVPEASACADSLAKANNLKDKMINVCGRVEDVLPDIMSRENGEKIRLILDPPRAGIDRSVLKAVIAQKIEKLVLISCNPATLARDLGILTGSLTEDENGALKKSSPNGEYIIERVTPFDMFPQTKHVETLVVLSHKKPDLHIEIKTDFENISLDKEAIAERAEQRKPKDKSTYTKHRIG